MIAQYIPPYHRICGGKHDSSNHLDRTWCTNSNMIQFNLKYLRTSYVTLVILAQTLVRTVRSVGHLSPIQETPRFTSITCPESRSRWRRTEVLTTRSRTVDRGLRQIVLAWLILSGNSWSSCRSIKCNYRIRSNKTNGSANGLLTDGIQW